MTITVLGGHHHNVKAYRVPTHRVLKAPIAKANVVHREYRRKKCEIVAELLFEVWDKPPGEYDLAEMVADKWLCEVYPLVEAGLDGHIVNQDKHHVAHG